MDQTQGSARYHTHFYDVAGAEHGGVALRHGLLPASDDPAVLQRLARTSADLMNTSPHLPLLAQLDTP